jgi:Na+:H+ antiporter, NhaC family
MTNSERQNEKTVYNKELSLTEAMIPVVILMILLAININKYGGEWMGQYSNHIILLIGAVIAATVGFYNKTSVARMVTEIRENLRSIFVPVMILLLVGALAGTWLISGVIPAMIYYGLQLLSPGIFLVAAVIICSIISLATGSSWTTSATVGIALIGIGEALGIPSGMIAGAVISGAYFGDKMSPLSDTTNLAPAMAGTDLFTHIRYMTITTVPTYTITILGFGILTMNLHPTGEANVKEMLSIIDQTFHISPVLFLVPATVIALILFIPNKLKTMTPIIALAAGVLMAAIFSVVFQSDVLAKLGDSNLSTISSSILTATNIDTGNEQINELFSSKGMGGMLWTIYLIISAMIFGGVMDAIGALSRITKALLSLATSVFGLFASTVASCIGLNLIASDQYLALVIPGKMFKKAFEDKGLAPENLSRTLEDSGTVTSALVPWNTCGAYQSGVLGVSTGEYFIYAIFNWVSPIMTLVVAGLGYKIRSLVKKQ